jgi:hypothetical protein
MCAQEAIEKVATTPEHFAVFKEEFLRWVDIFGLKGWEIIFEHKDPPEASRAYIGYTVTGRCATVFLSPEWENFSEPPTNQMVKKSAFHEACELLLARLYMLSMERYVQKDEIKEEIHAIIRTLENVLFPKYQEIYDR